LKKTKVRKFLEKRINILGQPPYGWYLHVQETDKPDKKIVALFNSDRDLLIENNAFFDPSYSLIGFVMKGPKVN